MTLDALAEHLPPDVARQLPALFARFRDEHGSTDLHTFVATLADRGLVDAEVLRRLMLSMEVVGDIDATATLRGPRYRTLVPVGRPDAWLARDRPLQRPVVVVRSEGADGEAVVREARVLAQLEHPGVPPVYSLDGELGPDGRFLHASYATRVSDDVSLDAALADPARRGAVTLDAFARLAETVAHAHARGVVHGRLDAEHVRIGRWHEVLVVGWGDAPDGTPDDDVAALAALLPTLAGPKAPPEVAAIAARRWESAAALAAEIRRLQRDEPLVAVPDTLGRRAGRWVARHRDRVLTAAMGLVLVIVALATSTVVGTTGAVLWSERVSAAREARQTALLDTTAAHARALDLALRGYEAGLAGLAVAAEHALATDPPPGPVYLGATYQTPAPLDAPAADFPPHGPADLARSPVYKATIGLSAPDVTPIAGYDVAGGARRLRQLASLRPALLDVLAASSPALADKDDAARAAVVFEHGVPVVWAYVATEDGVIVGLPGTGDYPAGYDPRTRPWYRAGRDAPGAAWGATYVDLNGMGLVVPCARAVHGPDGRIVGVAGLDVSISWLIDEWLLPRDVPVEAWLFDDHGVEIIRSSLADRARSGAPYTPEPFPVAAVPARVASGERNGLLVDGDRLVTWRRLDAVPWTYALVGDADALLGR